RGHRQPERPSQQSGSSKRIEPHPAEEQGHRGQNDRPHPTSPSLRFQNATAEPASKINPTASTFATRSNAGPTGCSNGTSARNPAMLTALTVMAAVRNRGRNTASNKPAPRIANSIPR